MADILDILIEILRIDCSVVQCYYANPIEGLFYLFFFPTVFIILFIYILTGFIFRGGGKVRGLKLLIAMGAYAFIIFQYLYTFFAAVSQLWWLLTILLVGLFAFVRYLFTGGHERGRGGMPGVGVARFNPFSRAKEQLSEEVYKHFHLETRGEKFEREKEEKANEVMKKFREKGADGLSKQEKALLLISWGVKLRDMKRVDEQFEKFTSEGNI